MSVDPQELSQMADERYNEDYISWRRDVQSENFSTWKKDISDWDEIVKGRWSSVFPAEVKAEEYDPSLKVQNIAVDSAMDLARICTETAPTLRSDPETRSQPASDKARLQEAIAMTYRVSDELELLIPELVMDFVGTGAVFLLSYTNSDVSPYPIHMRLDPRGVYPDIQRNELQDLLYVQRLKLRQAARLWPDLGLDMMPNIKDEVEVIDFYSPTEIIKCVYTSGTRGKTKYGYEAERYPNPIGRVPVAFAKMAWPDGAFRGLYKHSLGMTNIHNRIMTLIVDNAEQSVYAPVLEVGVQNANEYGPNALLHGDRASSTPPFIQRVPPSPIQGGLFGVMSETEKGERGAAILPAGRQGEISQAIASAAFVESTAGQQTTLARYILNYGLARVWHSQTINDFALDKAYLNFRKPLMAPSGNEANYTPEKDIPKRPNIRVVYGMTAGSSAFNAGIMVKQDVGALLISRELGREQLPYVADPKTEEQRIDRERIKDQFITVTLSNPQYPTGRLMALLDEGMTSEQAIAMVDAEQQAMMQAQQEAMQQQQQAQGQPGTAPQDAAEAALAMQKGGAPPPAQVPAPPPGQQFQPAPLEQLFVNAGR